MTTLSLSSTMVMGTTANLRTLGAELNGYLSTIGLLQQADTGQINWSTVTMPAINTAIGYEIWAFPDLSIYFRLDWKTANLVTSAPVITLTVGTGSNGSGTITGQTTTANLAINGVNSPILSSVISYTTYACLTSDAFWIVWKASGTQTGAGLSFLIEKSVDSSGSPTTLGFCVSNGGIAASTMLRQAVRTASVANTFSNTFSCCIVPGNITNSSTAAGSKQVFLHQYPIPDVLLSNVMATVITSEAPLSTTFTATLVGSTPQTMISMGSMFGYGNAGGGTATYGIALRWQ